MTNTPKEKELQNSINFLHTLLTEINNTEGVYNLLLLKQLFCKVAEYVKTQIDTFKT